MFNLKLKTMKNLKKGTMHEQRNAKDLIAGNFANFHRYGWSEVAAVLNEEPFFITELDKTIRKALKEAYDLKSVELLNCLMLNFNIKSIYELPTISLLTK
jgi:hypothetical protein